VSIAASDLAFYASASQPTDDVSAGGGAIDVKTYLDFTQIAANDTIQAISTAAGDTQNITVVGRNAAGALVSETKAMNGITAINLSTLGTVERVLSATLASDAIGTVTVRRTTGPTTLRTIAIGKRGFRAVFQQVASDPAAPKVVYAKGFWKNEHATLSLLSAVVKENADPDAIITFALAAAVDDTVTIANRLTAPAGGLTFDSAAKNVPGTDLAAASAIGVWLKLSLGTGEAAHKTTYTTELDGNSV
jgi:hypothetical protein